MHGKDYDCNMPCEVCDDYRAAERIQWNALTEVEKKEVRFNKYAL